MDEPTTSGQQSPPMEPTGSETPQDQWESLDFDFQMPQWSLKDLKALDPQTVHTSVLDLQSKLVKALREINTLQTTVSNLNREVSMASLQGAEEEDEKDEEPLWKLAWNGFRRGFTLTYFVRAGVGLSTKLLQTLRRRQWAELGQWNFLSESRLSYRVDAVRLGLFLGGFTSIYTVVHAYFRRHPEKELSHANVCLLAGTAAGLMVTVQDAERRRTLALYMAVRLAQCWYSSSKLSGQWPLLTSIGLNHGDALLFAIATTQVMYAYVMRPKTLPASYWNFLVKTGPIHPVALEAVRLNNRGRAVDLQAVNSFIQKAGGRTLLRDPLPSQIPLSVLHPGTSSSLKFAWQAFRDAFRKTFPTYFSLSVVPFVVLNFKRAMKQPIWTAWHAFLGALRSTSFVSAFVGLYMAAVSLQRKLFRSDFKLLYALAGVIASTSIFLEKRQRRAELALYILPRAIQSQIAIMTSRKLLPWIPAWEVVVFAASMGGLMYYREHEPETMAPFLSSCISRIVLGQSSKSAPKKSSLTVKELNRMSPSKTPSPKPSPKNDSQGQREAD